MEGELKKIAIVLVKKGCSDFLFVRNKMQQKMFAEVVLGKKCGRNIYKICFR